MDVTLQYDDRKVIEALSRLQNAGRNLGPAMRDIAAALETGVEDAFQDERSPGGGPWAELSEHTRRRRAKRGKWPGKVLQVNAHLAGSITSDHDSTSAVAGSNLVYAPTHQFGAEEGEFGSTAGGRPIPFGDIPARPFLGVSEETKVEILDAINGHFVDALTR